jgi:hypothetical protein
LNGFTADGGWAKIVTIERHTAAAATPSRYMATILLAIRYCDDFYSQRSATTGST